MKLCSACLLGIKCRYDGKSKANQKVLDLAKKETLIPVCPEQLGGLTTPRDRVELVDNQVLDQNGNDITKNYQRGAGAVLAIANIYNIKEAVLKQMSPSCGCGQIFDGMFSGTLITGDGITTRLLKKNGIKVISEEEV